MAAMQEYAATQYDQQQQGWQYYDNYSQAKASSCYGGYADNAMYQQQQWMQQMQMQQQWMPQGAPQDNCYAQQQQSMPSSYSGCVIDLDEYSDMSSDSEAEGPSASKAAKAAASKVPEEEPARLPRCESQVEPAAEPAPASMEAAVFAAPSEALKIAATEEACARSESSTPGTPGGRFCSSSSEPDAEASIKCESDFSDVEAEQQLVQTGELFNGGKTDLLRWRGAVSSRNDLGYRAMNGKSASKSFRDAGRAAVVLPSSRDFSSSWHASASSNSSGARSFKQKNRSDKGSGSVPQRAAKVVLEASQNSWMAKQRERRMTASSACDESDAEILRKIKGILNKLTIEKFPTLSKQLMEDISFDKTHHVEFLISELFEKATTQHHFIDMYGDLCALLQDFFNGRPAPEGDEKFSFKRLLLNECQRTFERCLKPPVHSAHLDQEERDYAERLYKDKMLGNIRFVGALLARNMLASKVLLAIIEELLAEPTPEALESLAVLLVQIGPIFDTDEWTYHKVLKGYFEQVKKLTTKEEVPNRIRCLLKDVMDLRSSDWEDRKPKRLEGPMKLDDVAKKAAADKQGTPTNRKSVSGKLSAPSVRTPLALKPPSAKTAPQAPEPVKAKASTFEEAAYRAEMQKAFAELRVSHDAAEATARLAAAGAPPAARQSALLCDMLVIIVEEANDKMRKAAFAAVAGLFLKGAWGSNGLAEGVRSFLAEACEDLRIDVPALPQILCKELKPAFLEPLAQKSLLQDKVFDKYLK
eukprot:TRINITY_DN893_c0_g1_i1.p1 TRINITY_DN893_c0_g1~~TRINITY_DN893_c0_g1_i1.p1  ORF type:complete len:758 (+),score=255.61 TRINITY_DN893_c0_g1_i1:86-2359(+)